MKVKGYITIQWVVMRAKWISGDLPAYPEEARQKLIHGPVKLGLRIGEDGKVRHVSVLSGNRALANPAAEEAVRWQFQTTLLSGKPIGVLTEVDLKYSLHHGKAEVRCTDGSAQRKH
jgi:TonB family protein